MGKDKCLSTVTADIKRNRLLITLKGNIAKKDAERIYTDIRFCVSDLKPGFSVINDLTESRIGHLSTIETFKKITSYLTEKQVGPVVRVVGRAKIIFQQMTKLTKMINCYQPMYAKTIEEAEILLADLENKSTTL